MFVWLINVVLAIALCVQSLYLLTFTFKKRTRLHLTLSVCFVAGLLTLVYVFIPIFPIYYIITSFVWITSSWVLLTVFAYRRPTVRLRVYEYSVVVWLCLFVRIFCDLDTYIATVVIMTIAGLWTAVIVHKNGHDEFAIGITARERHNPIYLKLYKKVEYEDVYVPPSLVGNKDIQETTRWHHNGLIFFGIAHLLAVLELISIFGRIYDIFIWFDIIRTSLLFSFFYFAIKIVN
eukprot:NODE_188_length_15619_cov_0.374871.p6 type:complete len:234 gc:universal NODE_188_length_15619_cov_0.374871:11849-11148(-)